MIQGSTTTAQPASTPPQLLSASSVSMQTLGDVTVLQFAGEITADAEYVFRSAVGRAGGGMIVLDLAQLNVIDSIGLGTLVAVARCAISSASSVKLMNVLPAVERFLRENNLLSVLELCSPREVITLWCSAVRCPESS